MKMKTTIDQKKKGVDEQEIRFEDQRENTLNMNKGNIKILNKVRSVGYFLLTWMRL